MQILAIKTPCPPNTKKHKCITVRCYWDAYLRYTPVVNFMSHARFQENGSLDHAYKILELTFNQLVDLNLRVWMK